MSEVERQEVIAAMAPVTTMDKVRNALSYKVNVFGYSVNAIVLALIIALIVGLVYYRRSRGRMPTFADLTMSSTSDGGLADIAAQMGGYSMNTPDFIQRL